MEPGRYVVLSRYHLADPIEQRGAWASAVHSEDLGGSVAPDLAVESNEVEFVIREFSDLERRQWEEYNDALRPLRSMGEIGGGVPQNPNMTLDLAVKTLEEYVERNPDSVAIRNAIYTLKEIYSWDERKADYVRASRELRRLGLSKDKLERQMLVEAQTLFELGELEQAVKLWGETNTDYARWRLEEIFSEHPDLRPREEPKDSPEPEEIEAPASSSQFSTFWIWAAGILIAGVVMVVFRALRQKY